MRREEVVVKINEMLIEEFEIEESQIVPDENMLETLEIDSLDLVDVVVLIEQEFGFKVDTEEMADITTLNEFYDYVTERTKA